MKSILMFLALGFGKQNSPGLEIKVTRARSSRLACEVL
jgi:hypothetical protein